MMWKTVIRIEEANMKRLFLVLAAVSVAMAACSDRAGRRAVPKNEGGTPLMVSFADLKWTELPEVKGTQSAVLSGDPKRGEYTQMRKIPAGTDNPLHTHSSEIKMVVISGVLYVGLDLASARDFGPGSVIVLPANWVHVSGCRAGSDCVFYQEGKGKFDYKPAAEAPPNR
jgi:quercetin dioxygenase-like cupin family protein